MNNLNSLLNQHQIQETHDHSQFDPPSSHDEFLHQMMTLTSAFPWADNQAPGQHQISAAAAREMMLQQQLKHYHSLTAANDLRSPAEADAGFFRVPGDDLPSFKPDITENDASIKGLFNGFADSLGQTTDQAPHFHNSQAESLGASAAATAASQPRQRVRARRGQATDPHSIAERLRRERIAERMKALQELVPNANRTDKASMLDEIIDYVKFLRLQVKVLSTSRLGGVAAVAPLLGDGPTQGGGGEGGETGTRKTEEKVAKLLEEDMGSAMQYLQGKGLCLMPISLASTLSTTQGQTSS